MNARLSQLIGVGLNVNDARFPSYLIRSILQKKNITLNTDGSSIRNSIYSLDAVTGILFILLNGKAGESYNISSSDSAISIADTVRLIVRSLESKIQLNFDLKENSFAPSTHMNLSNKKLCSLGWCEKTSYVDAYKQFYDFALELELMEE